MRRSAARCSSAPGTTSRSARSSSMVGELLGDELEVEHGCGARPPGQERGRAPDLGARRWPRELPGWEPRRRRCARGSRGRSSGSSANLAPLPAWTSTSYEGRDPGRRARDAAAPLHHHPPEAARARRRAADPRAHRPPPAPRAASRGRPLRRPPRRADPAYFSQAASLPEDLELRWHWEDEPLGTAGALKVVPDLDETFIAMNGDILTTLDYAALVELPPRAARRRSRSRCTPGASTSTSA